MEVRTLKNITQGKHFTCCAKPVCTQCRNIQNMAANYGRFIKQQAEELKHVTVFIMKLTFDQKAGNVTGTLYSDQRGIRSHCKVLICHTHVVDPKPCNKDIIQIDGTKRLPQLHTWFHILQFAVLCTNSFIWSGRQNSMIFLPTAQTDPHANQLDQQPYYQTGKYGLVQSKKDKRFPCLTDMEHLLQNLDKWNVRCISISI